MKRTVPEEIEEDMRPKWRKIGGGSFLMRDGRRIKPNQTFKADIEDIPPGFRDVVVPVGGDNADGRKKELEKADKAGKKKAEKPLPEDHQFEAKYVIMAKAPGWYDVVNQETGKPMNSVGLREPAAKRLIQELTA